MHIRLTEIWNNIVPISPFFSLSLTFKALFLKLEVGMRFSTFHNGSNTKCPTVEMGNSGQNGLSHTRCFEKTSLVFSQGGIVIKYLVYFKFITKNMDIKTFARVHVNLKLSGNEKFAVYGAIVKILANFKSSSAKACYLMVNINGGKYQWLQYH